MADSDQELLEDERIHTFGVCLEAVNRLNRIFDRSLREAVDLNQGSFEALLRIARSGGSMRMSDLAEQLAVTSGGVTRLVDRLSAEGMVERRPCETDRRVWYLAITQEGRSMLDEAIRVHLTDLDRELASRISPDERKVLVEVMDRLRSAPRDRPRSPMKQVEDGPAHRTAQ